MNTYVITESPARFGMLAFGLLLLVYFGLLTLISNWTFTVSQFFEFWYYIVPLGAGFGLQVALYTRLRQLLHGSGDARRRCIGRRNPCCAGCFNANTSIPPRPRTVPDQRSVRAASGCGRSGP